MKKAPHLYPILVLEDDLEVAAKLLQAFHRMEPYLAPFDLDVTLLSTCNSVQRLVNEVSDRHYDVIVLDRDCKAAGSFHVLDFDRFGKENLISISSTPEWNRSAQASGTRHIIPKSFNQLDKFASDVAERVLELLKSK